MFGMSLSVNMPNNIFEKIKHINEFGSEYWSARELCTVLGYGEFSKFNQVIEKAKEACKNSQQAVLDHIAHVGDMVSITGRICSDQY